MASTASVWGIEIGQIAVKAVKLRNTPEGVEVAAFDVVEHEKVLSQPNVNKEELISTSLRKFAERNDPKGEKFVIGVPGQQTFARFCKLPPADPKKIPALVVYEAQQQIPFEMSEVVWDFQKFEDPDSPDVEVGIFAMRKDLIQKHLEQFEQVGVRPYMVQTIPSALYNFGRYEYEPALKDGALVLIDVGTQNTDLIIVEANRAWYRNIPLGGSAFTEALVRAFKLEFPKAEQLKKSAASSKYARQIFQAMRPVFAELVAEIQRSIGFYASTHRETELRQVVAVGNAFRLPGLQKYIENNLALPGGVAKLEDLKRVRLAPELDREKFSDQVLNLAATCGLALQGLGEARITADLLPPELARLAVWKRKQWWFAAAAGVAGLAALLPTMKNSMDKAALAGDAAGQQQVDAIIREASRYQSEFSKYASELSGKGDTFKKYEATLSHKHVVPGIIAVIHQAVPKDPLLEGITTPEEMKRKIASLPRSKRKQMFIESLTVEPVSNIDAVSLEGPTVSRVMDTGGGGAAEAPGFVVHVSARVPYGETQPEIVNFLSNEYFGKLRELAQQPGLGFHIPAEEPPEAAKKYIDPDPSYNRVGGAGGSFGGFGVPAPAASASPAIDPVTGESTSNDWRLEFDIKLKLGDAPPRAEDKSAGVAAAPSKSGNV